MGSSEMSSPTCANSTGPQQLLLTDFDQNSLDTRRSPTNAQDIPTYGAFVPSATALGALLLNMTKEVQEERTRRLQIEKQNIDLSSKLEKLQKDMKSLQNTSASGVIPPPITNLNMLEKGNDSNKDGHFKETSLPELWYSELQDLKQAKEKACIDAHQRKMQVLELNACISMQHDELKALHSMEMELRDSVLSLQQKLNILTQKLQVCELENSTLKDEVMSLTSESQNRRDQMTRVMQQYTEGEASREHLTTENQSLTASLQDLRAHHDKVLNDLGKLQTDRDCLQHQVNHLKGSVAAKAAEAKAFQVYGATARDHVHQLNATIHRYQVFRRKINSVAKNTIMELKYFKMSLGKIRAPVEAMREDITRFILQLQKPVEAIIFKSNKYASVASAENTMLRESAITINESRRHLHDEIWKTKRNGLLICQLRHTLNLECQSQHKTQNDKGIEYVNPSSLLKANYNTGDLFLREGGNQELDDEAQTLNFDTLYSDRAQEWNAYESIAPIIQSVLDGQNACVTTVADSLPICLDVGTAVNTKRIETHSVTQVVLTHLFTALKRHGISCHRYSLTISFLAVYNESIYDLLTQDDSICMKIVCPSDSVPQRDHQDFWKQECADMGKKTIEKSILMNKIVVLETTTLDEALMVLCAGYENLQIAESNGLMLYDLAHRVITIELTYENILLSDGNPVCSKLQIVELAVNSQEESGGNGGRDKLLSAIDNPSVVNTESATDKFQSNERAQAVIAMENSTQMFIDALAEVRLHDMAFVRYHKSKLTVLCQDTIKAGAKFLGVIALPERTYANIGQDTTIVGNKNTSPLLVNGPPYKEKRTSAILKLFQDMRTAIKMDPTHSSSSLSIPSSTDRSLEGFINRMTIPSLSHTKAPSFTSISTQDRFKLIDRSLQNIWSVQDWEKQLDTMYRRHGNTMDLFIIASHVSDILKQEAFVKCPNESQDKHLKLQDQLEHVYDSPVAGKQKKEKVKEHVAVHAHTNKETIQQPYIRHRTAGKKITKGNSHNANTRQNSKPYISRHRVVTNTSRTRSSSGKSRTPYNLKSNKTLETRVPETLETESSRARIKIVRELMKTNATTQLKRKAFR